MSSIVKELPELVANNVITLQTAKDIENYYATRKEKDGSSSQLAIFGSIGAVLVGLGIILIFAHNWDNFSQDVKTMLALLPLFTFQVLCGYCIWKNKNQVWKDAAGTLLFFSVGSAMALVAQIYNIPGAIDAYLFTWTLLCFPLMYLLKSNTLAFLHLIFCTYYAVVAGYFDPERPWWYLFFIAVFIPFYINKIKKEPYGRITSLFSLLVPLSLIITLGGFLDGADEFGFLIYMALLSLIYNTGLLPKLKTRNDYLALGITGIVFILVVTSFRWIWNDVESQALPPFYYIALWLVLFAGALYMAVVSGGMGFYKNTFQAVTILFPVLYFIGMYDSLLATITDNIIVLALGIIAIRQGINRMDFRQLNFGLLTISALIICRFFDTNMSFAIRGLLFVTVGVGFFAANSVLIKRRKTANLNSAGHEN